MKHTDVSKIMTDASLIGQIVPVRITKAQTFSCYGEVAE